jgi:hypothetical protein
MQNQYRSVSLPDPLDAVTVKNFVLAHYRNPKLQSLRSQQPIEGVAVVQWQTAAANSLLNRSLQKREPASRSN